MSLGLRLIGSRLLLGMLKVDFFPSIHNNVVDGIPENYVHYYKSICMKLNFSVLKKVVLLIHDIVTFLLQRKKNN
jgi:hypothetical protein